MTSAVTILTRIVYTRGMPKNESRKLKLVAVVRVSTAGQLNGYGPEVQAKDMRRWARTNGHTIAEMLTDGVSGTIDDDERPELSKALAMVAAGTVDGLLVPNLDRLARELTVQEAALMVVWAHGGRVFAADQGEILADDESDPMRTFVRQVMGAAAQLERGLIVKRLKAGRAAKRDRGGYAGGAPAFGLVAVDGGLVVNDAEAAVLDRINEMHAAGMSLRAIAAALNDDGVPAKRGGRWQANTVARMVDADARRADAERATSSRARVKTDAKIRKATKLVGKVTNR